MTIGPYDDHPIHQSAERLAASPGRDFGERYLFFGWTPDRLTFFAAALGLWPGREVADAGFTFVEGGRQRSVLGSCRLEPGERPLRVGPLAVEIHDPLTALTLEVDAPGVTAGLTLSTDTVPDGERVRLDEPAATPTDLTRFTQVGRWQGAAEIDGRARSLDGPGLKRRSWGVEPVGERPERGVPLTRLPESFEVWAGCRFGDEPLIVSERTAADGSVLHRHGRTSGISVDFRPGTRLAASATISTEAWGDVHVRPHARLLSSGVGSLDPGWTDGAWKGEDAFRTTSLCVEDEDPTALANVHTYALCEFRGPGAEATGILEVRAVGAHRPSGLSGWTDGAS
jgi:hypothetical protein